MITSLNFKGQGQGKNAPELLPTPVLGALLPKPLEPLCRRVTTFTSLQHSTFKHGC